MTTRPAAQFRSARFWQVLDTRHPQERTRRVMRMRYFWQRGLPELDMVITMFVSPADNCCGVFLGRNAKLGAVAIAERLRPHVAAINAELGLDPGQSTAKFPFVSRWQVNCYAEDNWPAMADWLVTETTRYERVLRTIFRIER